jgi:hypothetical protein
MELIMDEDLTELLGQYAAHVHAVARKLSSPLADPYSLGLMHECLADAADGVKKIIEIQNMRDVEARI